MYGNYILTSIISCLVAIIIAGGTIGGFGAKNHILNTSYMMGLEISSDWINGLVGAFW